MFNSGKKTTLMGILNLTPDSFSDQGMYLGEQALKRVDEMIQEGADVIDIGGESSSGPQTQVNAEEEWRRIEPILSLIDFSKVFVSVDTWKASVAEKALKLGIQMINDVTAMRGDPRMIEMILKYTPYVCLLYSSYETPYAGQKEKRFPDIMRTIKAFLRERTERLLSQGFPREKIIIDPGMGRFLSNDPAVSFEVVDRLSELKELGFPILVGPSRKGFLGGPMAERDQRTLEVSKKCLLNGATIFRIHDVKGHKELVAGC